MEEISDKCINVGGGLQSDEFDFVLFSLQFISFLVSKGFPQPLLVCLADTSKVLQPTQKIITKTLTLLS